MWPARCARTSQAPGERDQVHQPRCITSLETGCDHIFALTPSGRYRCVYCEQEFKVRP